MKPFEQHLWTKATVSALADSCARLQQDRELGMVPPQLAIEWKHSSVLEIWTITRLEVFQLALTWGSSNLMALASMAYQREAFRVWFEDPLTLFKRDPVTDQMGATLQGLILSYDKLTELGSIVMDPLCDQATLKKTGRGITWDIDRRLKTLGEEWARFSDPVGDPTSAEDPLPSLFFDEVWTDVTEKTKSIAMSAMFGPSHHAGIGNIRRILENEGGDVVEFDKAITRLHSAKDPSDYTA